MSTTPATPPAATPSETGLILLAVRGTAPGPLFTSMRGRGATLRPVTGNCIGRILKSRDQAAGLPSTRVTGHSLCSGHITTAVAAGGRVDRIAARTRHRPPHSRASCGEIP